MTQATYAKFASEVSDIKEQVELKKLIDDSEYSGTINDFLENNSNYNDKLIMQEGELVYVSSNVSSRDAKWFEQMGIQKSSDYYTIEFDTAGGNHIAAQSIKIGKTAKQPNVPIKAGYIFVGWYYLNQSGTNENPTYEEIEFDFSTEITKNYQLYAKYSGEAIMTAYKPNQLFWQYKNDITSITFTSNSSLIPNIINESWNVKADNDCADIIAYLEKDTNILTIYSPNTIYANVNSKDYFRSFINLSSINFDNFNTSKVASMSTMFYQCTNLTTLDLKSFDTKNVRNMGTMFSGCKNLTTLDISTFKTSKVTHMQNMFSYCNKLESLDVSGFDTINVTNAEALFRSCLNLSTLNVTNFDTSKMTNMSYMFAECKNLDKINISNFNTSNVKNMSYMFQLCSNIDTLNIELDTSKVNNMQSMFSGCANLTTLNTSSFDTKNVTNMRYIFNGCGKLSNESLNNILLMCSKSINMEIKTLKNMSITSTQATKCLTLSNYETFTSSGWSTGY